MANKLLVPDIGDFEKVEIIEILVKKGDKIKKNHPIVTLESDKSSVEVPSVSEGVVESVNVEIGDKVSKGDLLVTLINSDQTQEKSKEKIEEKIPPVTEEIIKEAEKTLVLKKEVEQTKSLKKKDVEEIKVLHNGDIDPIETQEWIESLSAVLENDGRALLYFPIYNYTEFDYANVLTMLKHPHAIPGLSDGGAHVGTVCDASFPTYTLSHWTRDRTRGDKIELKDAVHFMTEVPAQYMGFSDRGVLKEGAKADINVIAHDKLCLEHPVMLKDLPGGGQRLMQRARGYRATIVSGEIVVENDQLTNARPGRLVRLNELSSAARI